MTPTVSPELPFPTHRAGRYARTSAGTPAYVPSPLNHARPVDLNIIERLLPDADRARGRMEAALAMLPAPTAIAGLLRRKEAVASGRLDGVQASLVDLLDLEAGLRPVGPMRDVAELRALSEGLAQPLSGPVAEHLLQRNIAFCKATGRRHPEGWRHSQVWLGAAGSSLAEARFVPPPPDEVSLLIQDWQQFIESSPEQHPLVKLSLACGQLENIHPFQDGNGRMVRLFLQHQLWADGLAPGPVLQWSQQQRWQLQAQQRALGALRRQGDVDQWVQCFLGMFTAAALDTAELLRQVALLRERHRMLVLTELKHVAPQALCVLDALMADPVVGIKDVIALTGTTFPAANELMQRLQRAGLVAEITGQSRNRRFRYAPFMRLFLEDED